MSEETARRRWRWWPPAAVVLLAAGAAVTYVYWPFGSGYSCEEPGREKTEAGAYREDQLGFRPTAVSPGGEYVAGMDKDFSEEEPPTELYHLARNGKSIWDGLAPATIGGEYRGTVDIIAVNDDGLMLLESDDSGWIIEDGLYRRLKPPEGYEGLHIGDLGADGTVVGIAWRAKDGDTERPIDWEHVPLRWEPGKTEPEPLPVPDGLNASSVNHILDDGRIVGDLRDGDLWADSDAADAWLWDGDGEPVKLSELVDFAGRDGKDHVIAAACDWLLLKVEGGLLRTTLSGDGEAEFLTDVRHYVANYKDTGYGDYLPRIDGYGRVFGSPNGKSSGSRAAGIRDDDYAALPGLDDPEAGTIVMGASDDGCVVAIWGDHHRSTMNCD